MSSVIVDLPYEYKKTKLPGCKIQSARINLDEVMFRFQWPGCCYVPDFTHSVIHLDNVNDCLGRILIDMAAEHFDKHMKSLLGICPKKGTDDE